MSRRVVTMRLPPALVARVDAAAERLGQTRTKFVERALEQALGAQTKAPELSGPTGATSVNPPSDASGGHSASARAPEPEPVEDVPVVPVPAIAKKHWA